MSTTIHSVSHVLERHSHSSTTNSRLENIKSVSNPNVQPFEGMTAEEILHRILLMLINEAADAYYLRIASKEHLDLAMTKGVNYPKGLLKWADEMGINTVLQGLEKLFLMYGEDRYRPSPILRTMARDNVKFYA